MRLTLRFLVKCFIIVVFLLFLLPVLMNHLDSQESNKVRTQIKKRGGVDNHDLKFVANDADVLEPPNPDDAGEGQQQAPLQRGDNPQNIQGDMGRLGEVGDGIEHEFPPKKYGPKAVLTPGKTGNFEPKYVSKSGAGEGGEPVYTSMAEKAQADKSVREYGFNMVASDKIAMDRNIPDTRLDECKYWQYPEALPNASVIIVFHNEGWSTLMRTVHSVIDTSPKHLLHEVVMVDDFSEKEHLKGRLEEYIKQFNGKVKLFRNSERLGLIMTRTLGAKYATGAAIVFLDAHCECNRNWLVPLLARIAYDRTIMAVPIIDSINWENFRYRPVYTPGHHFRGIFEWGFLYKESRVPDKELNKRAHNSEPYWSPTHAGGLFAMDRKYFFELGAYDPGLQIWGGENFELSFKLWQCGGGVEWVPCSHVGHVYRMIMPYTIAKPEQMGMPIILTIWQCGGSIEWVPCSRVGHVYRNAMPYGFGKISPKIPIILINYMRVVEVWLDDEFKEYFYTREPTIRGYPIGEITDQLAFKKQHQCKSFKWFMDNIAYEVYEKFPPPPPNQGWGEIKEKNGFLCWDTMGQHPGGHAIGLSACHHFGGNQMFRLNTKGQMAVGERCIDYTGGAIGVIYCPVQPTGPWQLDTVSGLFKHSVQKQCISSENGKLTLKSCDLADPKQQWEMNEVRIWQR